MPCLRLSVLTLSALFFSLTEIGYSAELTPEIVADKKSDGPDGIGNTADDTWQFSFALAHAPNQFHFLKKHSSEIPAAGIPRRVYGPPAGELPNPDDTVGWVYYRDWDARKEGVWADKKADAVLTRPYTEKTDHLAVAVNYKVPADGKYKISGGVTDMQVDPSGKNDGITWKLQVGNGGKLVRELAQAKKPIGDGNDRADSDTFEFTDIDLKAGQLVRLVIHPNHTALSDLTRIDSFKIEKQ